MNTERQKWLEWRKQGIGSSDVPAIMGVSPWKTAFQLWEEKISDVIGEDDSNSFIKRKGNEFEPRIRALYESTVNVSFTPALVQMEEYSFMRSSLDGRSPDGKVIIEIKLLGRKDWESTKNGKIPEKYWPQVQEQLLVSAADECRFLGYLDDDKGMMLLENLAVVTVKPDEKYQGEMLLRCIDFWACVEKRKRPELSDRDYKKLVGFSKQAARFLRIKKQIDKLDTELQEVRDELIKGAAESGHPRLQVGQLRLQKIDKVGNVDFAKIIADYHLPTDVQEKYRKSGSSYWKVE